MGPVFNERAKCAFLEADKKKSMQNRRAFGRRRPGDEAWGRPEKSEHTFAFFGPI